MYISHVFFFSILITVLLFLVVFVTRTFPSFVIYFLGLFTTSFIQKILIFVSLHSISLPLNFISC